MNQVKLRDLKALWRSLNSDYTYAARMTSYGPTCEGEIIAKEGLATFTFKGEFIEDNPSQNEDDYTLVSLKTETGTSVTDPQELVRVFLTAKHIFPMMKLLTDNPFKEEQP